MQENQKTREEKIKFIIENSRFFRHAEPALMCVPNKDIDKYYNQIEMDLLTTKPKPATEADESTISI